MFSLQDMQKRWVQLGNKIVAAWNFVPDLSITGHPDSNVWPAGAEVERVKRNIYNTSDFAFLIFHISYCRTMIVTFSVRL